MTDNNYGIPIQDVLLSYADSLPISSDAIYNILNHIVDIQEYPASTAAHAGRYPIRIILAVLPELEKTTPESIAVVCGLPQINVGMLAYQTINCDGKYSNEKPPHILRSFLIDITLGSHPEDSASRYHISDDEMTHLEYLLDLNQYWYECILERVVEARKRGFKYLNTARVLRNYNPFIIRSWAKEAKRFERQLKKAYASE